MTPAILRVIGLALAAVICGLDRVIKNWVLYSIDLRSAGPVEVLPFFDLRYVENYGVSLGMLTADSAEMRWLLVLLTATIAAGVTVWLLREKAWPDIIGLSMVLGGALGNIYDRYRFGFVVDYADLHFGEFRPFLIFNLADAAITIGVLIILARSLLSREKPEAETPAGGPAESSKP